jgi:hypothetical protein
MVKEMPNKEQVHIHMQPQYKGTASGGVITGYLVYAYIGHPLLGKVAGSERIYREKKEAEAYKNEISYRWANKPLKVSGTGITKAQIKKLGL